MSLTSSLQEKPKKRVYSKRRDYKAELEELTMYCHLSIEILTLLADPDAATGFMQGQMAALKAVLARIDKKP